VEEDGVFINKLNVKHIFCTFSNIIKVFIFLI